MTSADLATRMALIDPEAGETAAIENFAEAYRLYTIGAECNMILVVIAALSLGKTAMISALSGMSAAGAAAGKMQTSINSFWAATIPTGWPTNVGFVVQSGTMAGLQATFDSNTTGSKSKTDSIAAFALDFHNATSSAGGTCTFPGPVVAPII